MKYSDIIIQYGGGLLFTWNSLYHNVVEVGVHLLVGAFGSTELCSSTL